MKANLRTVLALLLLVASIGAPCSARADATESSPQTVLHLLDYVAVEYPQFVKNGIDRSAVEGAVDLPYETPNVHVDYHMYESGVPVGLSSR